jgi:hypothetical protein
MNTPPQSPLWTRFLPAIVALLVLAGVCGCATPYLITLNDGSTIQTKDEPKLNRRAGFYEFKDVSGKEARVNKDQIQKMERTR